MNAKIGMPLVSRSVIGLGQDAPEEAIERRYSLAQKLWWLILGRFGAALFLLGAHVVWIKGNNQQAWEQTLPRILIVCGLTALYTLAHRFSRAFLFQADSNLWWTYSWRPGSSGPLTSFIHHTSLST